MNLQGPGREKRDRRLQDLVKRKGERSDGERGLKGPRRRRVRGCDERATNRAQVSASKVSGARKKKGTGSCEKGDRKGVRIRRTERGPSDEKGMLLAILLRRVVRRTGVGVGKLAAGCWGREEDGRGFVGSSGRGGGRTVPPIVSPPKGPEALMGRNVLARSGWSTVRARLADNRRSS